MTEQKRKELRSIVGFFSTGELRSCITCGERTEARPGVRLCRQCLEVATVVLEAIEQEEAKIEALRAGKEAPSR
jgi:hypothetical protein